MTRTLGRASTQPAAARDRGLARRLVDGDLEALSDLYERHGTQAYGLALRISGDQAVAEDAVREAFVGAWRHAATYDSSRGSVRTWLLTVVHARAVDLVRRRRLQAMPTGTDSEGLPSSSLVLPDLWGEVPADVDRDAIARAIESVPEGERRAIELAYFEGRTEQDIASDMGVSGGTVERRIASGLVALNRSLRDGAASGAGSRAGS